MKFLQLLQVLWARRMLILLVLLLVIGGVAIVSAKLPKIYVATASVVVDSRSVDPVTGSAQPVQLMSGVRATQIDVISSSAVAARVAQRLDLAAHPDFVTPGVGMAPDAMQAAIASRLKDKLSIKPSRDSNVIEIQIEDRSPRLAADIANAYAAAYIDTSLQLQMDPMRRQATWFDEQLQGLRTALEAAQERLAAYQQRENIVGNGDRLDVENARLAEISNQLVGAQAEMYDAQTRLRQANQALGQERVEEIPDILGNSLLQSMKADLARAEAKFAEVRERYDRNHPQYIASAAEVTTLRSRVAAELKTVQGSLRQTADIAQRRAGEMQRALDQQRDRILALQQQRDGYAVLNREVENAQRAYDAALQRASEVRLQSQLNQSSVAVLNTAVPPALPARPNVLRNLILSVVLGAMVAAGLALAIEMLDRRVHSSVDLTDTAHLPVLAELPRLPRHPPQRLLGRHPSPASGSAPQPA